MVMESKKHQKTVKVKHFMDAVDRDDLETIKCSIASVKNKCQINRACIVDGEEIRGKFTPLSYAVKTKKLDIVSVLLENGADVNCKGWCIHKDDPSRCLFHNPLFLACTNNDPTMIKMLAENGAHINTSIPDVRVEEEEGGSIEYSTEDTYLHWAVRNGKEAVVIALLENGANPNHRNHFDTSPLHIACETCNFSIIRTLVKFGGHFEPDVISWVHLIECLVDYDVSRAHEVLELVEEKKEVVLFLLSTSYNHRNSFGLELLGQMEKNIENSKLDHCYVNLLKQLLSNPSPLIQICRATIRKLIGKRYNPGVLSCLPLPSNLVKYLSLDS